MTPDLEVTERLKGYLDEGERVLWHGAPRPGIRNLRFRMLTTLLGIALLAWGIAASGSEIARLTREGPDFNTAIVLVIGLALIAGGLHYGIHQWHVAALAHLTTRYALTNRCAYIVVGTGFGSMESYIIQPDTATELDRYEGYSDLWLHVRYKHASEATVTTARVGFEGISDGEKVFMLLRSIQMGTA
jgi:hypothetical protein